jgi:plasmid maintenance system antidote protein VapI
VAMVRKELRISPPSAPGETIEDILEENSITVEEFSQKINKSLEFTKRLLKGLEPIDEDLAEVLSKDFGFVGKDFLKILKNIIKEFLKCLKMKK